MKNINQPEYRFYVVDINKQFIDSGWEYRQDAIDRAAEFKEEGGVPKICNKNRVAVGALNLDPDDDASWVPRRNAHENPIPIKRMQTRPPRASRFGGGGEVDQYICPVTGRRGLGGYGTGCRCVGCVKKHHDYLSAWAETRRSERRVRQEIGGRTGTFDIDGLGGSMLTSEPDLPPVQNPLMRSESGDPRRFREALGHVREAARHARGAVHAVQGRPTQNPRLNPSEPDTSRAEKVYEMWHKKEPNFSQIVRAGCNEDDEMVCVGKANDIVYRSGKWEKGRKTNDYVHTFDSRPSVYMLRRLVDGADSKAGKLVGSLLSGCRNADGHFAVAELASPLSFSLVDGTTEGHSIDIHNGSHVYGAVDKRTVIIADPQWKLIVIKGGRMRFDERGIVY